MLVVHVDGYIIKSYLSEISCCCIPLIYHCSCWNNGNNYNNYHLMSGKSLLHMYRSCLHEICCWETIAKEPHPNGMKRMMVRLQQSQYRKTFLYSQKDCRKPFSLIARFAYPFILLHCHRLISYFFLQAVALWRVTFFLISAFTPTLHLHLPWSASPTLSVNPYHHYHHIWCDAGVSMFCWDTGTLLPDYILSHCRDISLQKVWAWDWLH